MKKITCAILIVLFASLPTFAIDRHIPAGYATLENAIADSCDGDVIILDPNTYSGSGFVNLSLNGLAITIRSTEPNDPNIVASTIIDCAYTAYAFNLINSEDTNSILNGLTIRNGTRDNVGSAVHCYEAGITIKNCRFISCGSTYNNYAISHYGKRNDTINIENCYFSYCGSVYFSSGIELSISDCVFEDCDLPINFQNSYKLNVSDCNFTRYAGGMSGNSAIYVYDANYVFLNNSSTRKYLGSIYMRNTDYGRITGCDFRYNYGDPMYPAVYVADTEILDINDCDILYNNSNTNGAGVYFSGNNFGTLNIKNSKINHNNSYDSGAGIYCNGILNLESSEICYNAVTGNNNDEGAGIRVTGGYFDITRCLIKGNKFTNSAINGKGGGIYAGSGNGEQKIENCIITCN